MYIIFNDDTTKYKAGVQPFVTQRGNYAIRVISEAPINNSGFKVYSNNDTLIGDYSEYKILYNQDDNKIEYVEESTDIVMPVGTYNSDSKSSSYSVLSTRISRLDNKVSAIEPYVMDKQAYIGDTECVFDKVKDGAITVTLNGNSCNYRVEGNKVIAEFEALEEVATVRVVIGGV